MSPKASKSEKKNKSKKKETKNLKSEVDVDFHKVTFDVLYERHHSDFRKGMSSEMAEKVLAENGLNMLTPPKKVPEFVKFLMQFANGFAALLGAGSLLSFGAYGVLASQQRDAPQDNLYLGVVLLVVVLVTSIFGYFQEAKSSKIMDSFKKLIPRESIILRDGKKISIQPEKIVLGDIVYLKGGDFIPADIRIIEASGFKVDNSSITGESEPQKRSPQFTNDNLLETANIIFAFTYAVEGTATGIVVATGDDTVMGRIATLTSGIALGKTPIRIEIEKFVRVISIIASLIAVTFFIISLVNGVDVISSFIFLIGILVANVPEGLLVTVTLSFSLTAREMANKNCLIKHLESVETLGSTSVICSDKTGTLTQNRMTVSHLWYDSELHDVVTSEDTERTTLKTDSDALSKLSLIAGICNRAEFRENQSPDVPVLKLTTNGDASESALLKYVELFVGPVNDIRQTYKKAFEIPFNSVNKYQLSVHESPDDKRYLLVIKGAPERIIERCKFIVSNNKVEDLSQDNQNRFNGAYEKMGGMGERVLGFAYAYLPEDKFPKGCELCHDDKPLFSIDEFIFTGLISMIDPPRAAVPRAVELCRSAGIKVIMVTGDHPITARAIAKNVGIITKLSETYEEMLERVERVGREEAYNPDIAAVITGNDLRDMNDSDLDDVINFHKEIVFARTSPQQKLIIVEGFQRSGAIVAVTGDGVNDAPALRQANIGVAMGIAGSDVAKQAAHMILLDDNFASIVTGVEQGRIIFDNLKKSIAYTLTSNIPEITPFLINVTTGIPLALNTITILCIDLGTDMLPAISLAYEKAETDIMKRKPRNPKKERLVSSILINYSYLLVGVTQALAGYSGYIFLYYDNGFDWSNLLKIGSAWSNPNVHFVLDAFGQEWSFIARRNLERSAQTVFFVIIVIMQWVDLVISKTRRMSIFQQGLVQNKMLIFGLFFETLLAIAISYIPFLNTGLQTFPFHPKYLIPGFIYAFTLWFFDEIRKLIIRRYPNGFIQRETYY